MNLTLSIIGIISLAIIGYVFTSVRRMKKMPAVEESKKIITLNERNFQQITKNSITLVDFWAEWCMPCKMMSPILNDVAESVDGKVNIAKINVDIERNLASRFSVRSIPTLILLKNGKEVNRFVGIKQKDFLLKQINSIK